MVFQKKTNAVRNKASEMPQRAIKKEVLKFEDDEEEEDDDDIDEEDDEDSDDSDEADDDCLESVDEPTTTMKSKLARAQLYTEKTEIKSPNIDNLTFGCKKMFSSSKHEQKKLPMKQKLKTLIAFPGIKGSSNIKSSSKQMQIIAVKQKSPTAFPGMEIYSEIKPRNICSRGVGDSDEEDDEDDSDDDDDDEEEEEEEDSDSDEPETNKIHKKVAGKKQMLNLNQKKNSQPLKKDTLQQKLKMNTSQIKPPKKDTSQMKTPKNAQGLSPANDKKPVNLKNSTMLQQQKQKTPKKEAGPNKFVDSKSPHKRMAEESNNWELQRKKERDSRNLFIRNLPIDVTVEEIRSLSPDILGVSIPQKNYKRSKARFAFLEFSNEEKAEENYVFLQKKAIRSCEIFVDYVGEKSKNLKVTDPLQGKTINKTKLYASGLPIEANMEDIAKLFPNAYNINLTSCPEHRACVASFVDEAAAEEAYKSCANAKVKGRSITVLYSLERPKNKRKRKQKSKQNSPQKRMKQEQQVKQESDDDDDDDDDDE